MNGQAKEGSTGVGGAVLPVLPIDDGDDPLGAAIDPVEAPPDDDSIVTEQPPNVAKCPCWRVYLDWWGTGTPKRRPGVYYHGRRDTEDGAERIDEWVCDPLLIQATTFDRRGESFGRLLRFRDNTGRWHEWNMPMAMLRGDCVDLRGELLHMGLRIDPKSRAKLPHYLMALTPKRRVLAALALGWHDGSFVLPDEVIGDGDIRFQSESASPPDFERTGTLEGWRTEVSQRAPGNDALTLAISAALAGPLLELAHVEHGGLHFWGDSSAGKTTIVQCAVSVWGGRYLLRTWSATANGLEAAAAESNDSLLALDEIGQAPGREIGSIIYRIANGQGKSRANTKGGSRRRSAWRTVLLSSGEKTVEDYMRAEGARYHAGQDVRLVNLPVGQRTHGVFDDLHGAADGRAFANSLKTATKRHHGTAGPAFVRWLVDNPDPQIGAAVEQVVASMECGGGQESRVAHQLGLIAVAGELATSAGITGWPAGVATQAARAAFGAWQAKRGRGNAEDRQILDAVRSYIERHGDSRFDDRSTGSRHLIRDRAGYTEDGPDGVVHLFLPSGLRDAVAGHDLTRALATLSAAGWLIHGAGRKHRVQRKIDGRNTGVYAVRIPDDTEGEP
ncbi:DUF927 domain-containing protein [uncultured Thiohalocapsa sp.]|uniref:DUF927 domain-containing protein n=1 Tax=uncultured Thiohalocapsa sp. TaxID=768990 RepID=UPI0025E8B64B|nr:DUF927 domain-containing protein [uncultured Thiohalocapsa sp.]